LVKKGFNQQKMSRDIDFRAPGGRESLWATGEKTEKNTLNVFGLLRVTASNVGSVFLILGPIVEFRYRRSCVVGQILQEH
jgi:hypothetical protein